MAKAKQGTSAEEKHRLTLFYGQLSAKTFEDITSISLSDERKNYRYSNNMNEVKEQISPSG